MLTLEEDFKTIEKEMRKKERESWIAEHFEVAFWILIIILIAWAIGFSLR